MLRECLACGDVGALLSRGDGSILAYARALANWHRQHRFCGVCGTHTQVREAGHLLLCGNPACAPSPFPGAVGQRRRGRGVRARQEHTSK